MHVIILIILIILTYLPSLAKEPTKQYTRSNPTTQPAHWTLDFHSFLQHPLDSPVYINTERSSIPHFSEQASELCFYSPTSLSPSHFSSEG